MADKKKTIKSFNENHIIEGDIDEFLSGTDTITIRDKNYVESGWDQDRVRIVLDSGGSFDGQMIEGKKYAKKFDFNISSGQGRGELYLNEKLRYSGHFKNFTPHGEGILIYSDCFIQAEFEHGSIKPDTKIIVIFENGSKYEGHWGKGELLKTDH
jgi:hypothetical protein